MSKDIVIKYGKSENLPEDITPGVIYFTRNDITGQGEIFYDLPDDSLTQADKKRLSVIGGGIYVGDADFPQNYNIRVNPFGVSTPEAHYDEETGQYFGGTISAEDKRRLDSLWDCLGNLKFTISDTEPDYSINPDVDTITIVVPPTE